MLVEEIVINDPTFRRLTYEQKAQFIAENFDVEVEGRDIWLLEEPSIEEEQLDLQLMYQNNNLL